MGKEGFSIGLVIVLVKFIIWITFINLKCNFCNFI